MEENYTLWNISFCIMFTYVYIDEAFLCKIVNKYQLLFMMILMKALWNASICLNTFALSSCRVGITVCCFWGASNAFMFCQPMLLIGLCNPFIDWFYLLKWSRWILQRAGKIIFSHVIFDIFTFICKPNFFLMS